MKKLRLATQADEMLYFEWANDEQVRAQSFQSDPILLENHLRWFRSKLQDPNTLFFLLENEGVPVGQIRFSLSEKKAVIGYSVAAEARGKGYGNLLIEMGIKELKRKYPTISTVIGYVKTQNIGSNKAFQRMGFLQEPTLDYEDSFKYTLAI